MENYFKLVKKSKSTNPKFPHDKNNTSLLNQNNNTIDENKKYENEKNEKYCTDIALSRLFLHKRNNYFTERGFLKQICISPKDIVSNVNESYDYLQKNKTFISNKLFNSKIKNTINRFKIYKDKCKEISKSLTRNHQKIYSNTTKNTISNKTFYDNFKLKEMSALLSNNTIMKNENEVFKNLVRELKFYFNEDYDIISEYFKINANLIKNEGRQSKFFNIALELIEQIMEIYEEKNINNSWDIAIELYNALFEDFREHLSYNSLNRANFLYKLWNLKQEQIDKKISKINESLNETGIKIEGLNEKNSLLLEEIKTINQKNNIVEHDKFNLKNENERLKLLIPEKDKRIEDLEHIISDLNEDLQKRINSYSELLNKYNARIKGSQNFHVQSSIRSISNNNSSSSKLSDSSINNNINENINENNNDKSNKTIENNLIPNLKENLETIKSSSRKSVNDTQRRNQILRGVINKVKKKEYESSLNLNNNVDNKSSKKSFSKFGNLKTKIMQTSNYINDLQKLEINPNIFSENLEVEKPILLDNINNNIIEKKVENKEKIELDLYMNKGVELTEKVKDEYIQTEITGTTNDNNISNDLLNGILKGENNQNSKDKLNQFLIEYDMKNQEVIKLRDELEKFQDINEQIVETYSDLLSAYKETMKNSNEKLGDFLEENEKTLNENTYSSFVNLCKTMMNKFKETMNENKVSDMYDYGDDYLNNFKMLNSIEDESTISNTHNISNNNININISNNISHNISNNISPRYEDKKKRISKMGRRRSSIFDINKINQARTKAFQKKRSEVDFNVENFNYELIYHDFYVRKKDIKLSMTLRKVLRFVDSILFDFIEQAYFRKDKLKFSRDERYLDFGETVYFYFLKSFGVEKLVQKKYISFLRCLFEYEKENSRVKIFINLLQIKRYELNEEKKNLFRKRSSSIDNNTIDYFSNFVSRQIILTIQFLRVNNFLIKIIDEQGIPIIYIKYPRLTENLINHFSNFHLSQETKDKIINGIEKNKKNIEKILNQVISFDKLIDILVNIFIVYEYKFSSLLKTIFNSFCYENKLNKLEYLTINEYLLGHKVPFDILIKLFDIGKEKMMDFERFETNVLELDNLDITKFNVFANINIDKVKKILLHLKEIILSKQLNVFDKIINRIKLVKYKHVTEFFIEKCNRVKNMICNINDEDFDIQHFLSIKLLDKASYFLYQDNKVTEIFGSLDKIQNLINIYNPSENENYLLSYIRSKNLK